MGHLQKFHERYGKEGLQVFAIAMKDELDEARATTKEKGWAYAIFNGVGSELGDRYAFG